MEGFDYSKKNARGMTPCFVGFGVDAKGKDVVVLSIGTDEEYVLKDSKDYPECQHFKAFDLVLQGSFFRLFEWFVECGMPKEDAIVAVTEFGKGFFDKMEGFEKTVEMAEKSLNKLEDMDDDKRTRTAEFVSAEAQRRRESNPTGAG